MRNTFGCEEYYGAPNRSSSLAFTRLDLVATTFVLGFLGLLSMAAASNNRGGSQSAVCLANLRGLTQGWQQFALDHGHFAPNPDDGNISPGYNWVPGSAAMGSPQEFNSDILGDRSRSLLFGYLRRPDVAIFRCPSDASFGKYEGRDLQKAGTLVPKARSYSMNGAVGTNPYLFGGETPVDGPWLDNNHSHQRGETWRTYGRFDDIVAPSPEGLVVLVDEDAFSIGTGLFGFGMQREEWISRPATRHNSGGTLSFADGHVELRHWIDPQTAVRNGNVRILAVPGSVDYAWLHDRISARIHP